MPEGEKEEQEIENLYERTMKENFSDLVKEIDQQIQEAQRVPNKLDPKRTKPRHIIIKMPKVKDKDRILKAAREKQRVTYKQVPTGLSADFSKETAGRKGLARCIQSDEKQGTYLGCRPDARWGTHERQPHKVMKSKDLQL